MLEEISEAFRFAVQYFVNSVSGFQLTFAILTIGVALCLYSLTGNSADSKAELFPPGPWGFPIVGHLPLLGKNPLKTFAKYRQRFGDVYSIRMGSLPVVVLNGVQVIKDAMTTRPNEFAGRPQLHISRLLKKALGGSLGLAFSTYSPGWKIHRKITNNALRMFANYRNNPVEATVQEEATKLVNFMLAQNGVALDPREEIYLTVGSVIYQILFGRQTNVREDENFCRMTKNIEGFTRFARAGNAVDMMPWTRFIFQDRVDKFLEVMGSLAQSSRLQVGRHQDTYNCDDIRDVTDALLQAADDISPEEKQTLDLTHAQILSALVDLQVPGFNTISTTLMWAILYMVNFPDIQRRVHSEIDKHIGVTRLPTYEDRKEMPYLEATILEILRMSSVLPLGFPHESTTDVSLQGYTIPKGTFVVVNFASTCTDPKVWEDPGTFNPDRFLVSEPGQNGSISIDTTAADNFLAFGAGRRRCLGEFLAKVEVFIFFTAVMQRCAFTKVPGLTYDMEPIFGSSLKTKPYTVIVHSRS